MSAHDWITPDWPAPRSVRAFVTTRAGGVSEGEHGTLNLGMSSGDDPERVARNRAIVRSHLPCDPIYLAQVHGTNILDPGTHRGRTPADAAVTGTPHAICAVLTADCMPVFLCNAQGSRIGVAHAGWRGMAAGVLENAVAAIGGAGRDIMAWMGPAIGPDAFEVGPEVRQAFMDTDVDAATAFRAHRPGKYMADLYTLARQRLARAGVDAVYGGGFCTFHEAERFFSYRRVKESGRMGAFTWIAP